MIKYNLISTSGRKQIGIMEISDDFIDFQIEIDFRHKKLIRAIIQDVNQHANLDVVLNENKERVELSGANDSFLKIFIQTLISDSEIFPEKI
jgi:hypothetical protein